MPTEAASTKGTASDLGLRDYRHRSRQVFETTVFGFDTLLPVVDLSGVEKTFET